MSAITPQLVIRPISMTDLWIEAGPLSINIVARDDGVSATISPTYGDDDTLTETWVLYTEGHNEDWYEKDENPG